ncbi:MAG: phospho-sugar mutase [Pirellulales bacterium]|nr:phospho-sugar mutase [Pirellulales bacterium]
MAEQLSSADRQTALTQLEQAEQAGQVTHAAAANIREWLNEPRFAEYAPRVAADIGAAHWRHLDDAFWTVIPFGTGGRRGKMYPVGTNAINDRTMGESAQGLADYVRENNAASELSCAIAYDTRHKSRHFAELCAEILVAAGFKVYFLDGYRSTPELSVAVRHKRCSCGIMITASHNPPSDNAIKAYWSTGGQLLPPHDKGVIERVMAVQTIERIPFDKARAEGRIVYCQEEVDRVYLEGMLTQRVAGPRQLKVVYSPMHGVGASAVLPVLAADGFEDVELFEPHAQPDGDFPNVPGHVSNPENPATFDAMIVRAKEIGADLVLSTDPDADRLGCAAPRKAGGEWATFTGNQIAALLAEFLCEARRKAGATSPEHYLVKTLVTSDIIRRIGESYGVRTYGDLPVGFKWIAGLMDEKGPDRFLFGAEESHGFLAGTYSRDKDAGVAALLLAELAAQLKAERKTLWEKLEALYWQYGYHAERTVSQTMPGSEGMARMTALMQAFRSNPPQSLGGIQVAQVRDFQHGVVLLPSGERQPLDAPRTDMVMLDLAAAGNSIAVRPSGTEPKVKFYMFAYEPAEMLANLDDTREELDARFQALEKDLAAYAEKI